MANPVWPATLPAYVQESGYNERLPDQGLESSMESGPPKVRRRFTTNWRPFGFAIKMTAEQGVIFENFYTFTLAGGTLPFDWVHPRTRAAATFQFRRPPPTVRPEGEAVVYVMTMDIIA